MTAIETDTAVFGAYGIVKTYGGIRALDGVDFEIHPGTVTTLFGENGAGKSTLMKILSGVEQPTDGRLVLDGEPVTFVSAADARDRGIAIIHQELSLAPNLSVRDNVFMGRELRLPGGAVDFASEAKQAARLLAELQEDIDPLTPVAALRLGQQQIVEIARALSVNARILIMDEPTSALSAPEVEVLFGVIAELKARGVAIVYISHHLEEALAITDRAVVLRDGTVTADGQRSEIDLEWVVRNMVGANYDLGEPPAGSEQAPVALEVRGLVVADQRNGERMAVDGIELTVRAGEVVCLYGLMGAGRTELLEAIAGRVPVRAGRILLQGTDIAHDSIAERIDRGLGLVPEDRQRDGLVQTMTVGRNLSLASIARLARGLFLSGRGERALVAEGIDAVKVKTAGPDAMIGSLSGGNQQKVVIGKILATEPSVILLDEPSRGIDIGAKGEVFRLLAQRAQRGLAVVYSTSEVGECLSIAHRILVLRRGRIAADLPAGTTKETIMAAAGESVNV
jgi:erythritol transport system ATP-binding protein